MIAGKESLSIEPDAVEALIETSSGDLRRAITTLQSCASLKLGVSNEGSIRKKDVFEVSGVIPKK
jgi:replication factor C subunit 2/4